jgi:hypothetical protein
MNRDPIPELPAMVATLGCLAAVLFLIADRGGAAAGAVAAAYLLGRLAGRR